MVEFESLLLLYDLAENIALWTKRYSRYALNVDIF